MTIADRFNLLLLQSAKVGNSRQVATALTRGAQVNATDVHGTTALMFAAQKGFTQIVERLLLAGADANVHRHQFGTTALMLAAGANRLAVVEQLLAQGVDVNATNEDGSTALMGATLAGAQEIVAVLLAAGADVRQIDTDEDNALNLAISYNYPHIVRQLIDAGADLHYRRSDGKTPLLLMSAPGDPMLSLLLTAGADPHAVDLEGDSLLIIAAERGDTSLIQLLLAAGAAIDLQNHEGWTALIAATAARQIEIVQILLEAGADPHLPSQELETALHLAAIAEGEASSTGGDGDLVGLLIKHGAKTDRITSLGDTPLVLATLHGHTAAVAAILAAHPDLDAHQQGATAFGLALLNRYSKIARLLLAAGVSPTQILPGGQTPSIVSAIHGDVELMRSLIDAGVDLDTPDDTGATALMWATHRQQYPIIKLLLAAGSDRTCKNLGGLTALDLAQMNRDRHANELLRTERLGRE